MAFETINLGTQPAGTGGDTARSAFEKTNRNFLAADVLSAAMSQAQFEAIRSQNKEKYAASAWVHKGKHAQQLPNIVNVNEGLWTFAADGFQNRLTLGRVQTYAKAGKSKTDSPVLHAAGVLFDLSAHVDGEVAIKFPQAPDGKTTYNKSTGVVTTHATVTAAFNAQAADPTNVEVVTDRIDMWGFESWLEEVSVTNPYIYPNGLPQSQATTMDGIPTSSSNRPVTYYAVFDGDTGSKGKGLNFFALTDAQKKKVLADHKNNLHYLDDGRLVQWRLRVRSFVGAGNGDWEKIDSMVGDSLKVNSKLNITAQGQLDHRAPYVLYEVGANSYRSSVDVLNYKKNIGVYTVLYTSNDTAVNGECYFLVCGTVNRLNQGAYHPSFNPSGSKVFWRDSGGASNPWHQVAAIPNTARCFDMSKSWNSADNAGYPRPDSGNIGAAAGSGRPDGRLYDAIYASGQGGVCRDMRYSANEVDAVDFAEADRRVKNGTYRGFEGLPYFRKNQFSENGANRFYFVNASLMLFYSYEFTQNISKYIGSYAWAVSNDGDTVIAGRINGVIHSSGYAQIEDLILVKGAFPANGSSLAVSAWNHFGVKYTTNSVGGSFLQTDVIGNPANILATPALTNGWQGSWIPYTASDWVMSRKAINSVGSQIFTADNGTTWGNAVLTINTVTNATPAGANNLVWIGQYQAFAKQTENAIKIPVYGGDSGVPKMVDVHSWFDIGYGTTLVESCLGKILTNSNGNSSVVVNEGLAVTSITFDHDCGLHWYRPSQLPKHAALSLGSPLGSTLAMKSLSYDVNINQQANIQFIYAELKYNGTNWGDDGKVTIVDNQSTKTDLNGNTVLVGTAKLKEPIGWIKNKV
ncbi:hypothetical protein [Shewanella xiamenensis]|uniref:Tail fiber protein n=1 Tax=Shewanella xiamenensis TaxID=332186 RepID=A0ABT6U8B6_9GAMM|nr:hypothetical protein [Shewanella xiamenensis]MDI5830708.1 hypothetical protein [Shewanella xiamenensis]